MINKYILLVDDDEDDQTIFMEALAEIDTSIQCAKCKNGFEAISYLETNVNNLPAVIFLDLNMPLMNGFEFLTGIKSRDQFKNIPIIIFTTSDNVADQKRALILGADKFVTKTSDFRELKKTINDILHINFEEFRITL